MKDIQQSNGAVDPKSFKPGDTPGVIGYTVPYRGKAVFSLDMSIGREIRVGERIKTGIKANISNFLNHPFRNVYGNTTITGTTFGQVTQTNTTTGFIGARTINLRAYVDF